MRQNNRHIDMHQTNQDTVAVGVIKQYNLMLLALQHDMLIPLTSYTPSRKHTNNTFSLTPSTLRRFSKCRFFPVLRSFMSWLAGFHASIRSSGQRRHYREVGVICDECVMSLCDEFVEEWEATH